MLCILSLERVQNYSTDHLHIASFSFSLYSQPLFIDCFPSFSCGLEQPLLTTVMIRDIFMNFHSDNRITVGFKKSLCSLFVSLGFTFSLSPSQKQNWTLFLWKYSIFRGGATHSMVGRYHLWFGRPWDTFHQWVEVFMLAMFQDVSKSTFGKRMSGTNKVFVTLLYCL